MTTSSVAQTAKEIRKALKEAFPGQKFSVRSSNYSMGSSIRISWTDGPISADVREVAQQYESVSRCEYTGDILSGGNRYIFCEREVSDELMAWAKQVFESKNYADDCFPEYRMPEIYREIASLNPQYTACDVSWKLEQALEQQQPATDTAEPIEAEDESIDEDLQVLESVECKAVTPYRVTAKFANLNKRNTIIEYYAEVFPIEGVQTSGYSTETVNVCYEANVNHAQWNAICRNFLADISWLSGKGGTSSDFPTPEGLDPWCMADKDWQQWKQQAYLDECIIVKCHDRSIIIDPQGYSYARYVGLDVQPIGSKPKRAKRHLSVVA